MYIIPFKPFMTLLIFNLNGSQSNRFLWVLIIKVYKGIRKIELKEKCINLSISCSKNTYELFPNESTVVSV